MEAFDDDDFGEIYADLELEAPLSVIPELCNDEQLQRTTDPKSNGNFDSDGYEKMDVVVPDGKKNDDVCVGSDSDDDDLNIVLNDDGCSGLPPVRVGGFDDVDGGDDRGGCADQLDDRSQTVSRNGVKGGYGSRFFHRKHTRTWGSMLMNYLKASVNSTGMASLENSRMNGDSSMQSLASSSSHNRMYSGANPTGVQCGYGSFLPWYWSIFDVNIETFPEKPWRVPGVDITEYFNFGFNENTWKLYCASLEQLWQTSWETSIPDDESLKLNQPKGRAILVEDSMIERQPSIDVRRPQSRDSDVIIQIKVHESSDDCSGSRKSIVMDASLEVEPISGNDRNIPNSSGEQDDVLSDDQLEDVKKSLDSSAQERTRLIPGEDEDGHQDKMDQQSEDAVKVPREEIKAEDSINTCSADPCWIESELSLGDQDPSLTSYTDSDSETTNDSLHVDNGKCYSPLRRKSVNSVASLKEYVPRNRNASKNNNFNIKPVNVSCYAKNGGPFRKEWRHQSGRLKHGSYLNEHFENDNVASSIPMSNGRALSLMGHQNFFDHNICKERRQTSVIRNRRDISYSRETKQSYYGSEKINVNGFQTQQTKYSYRGDREVFREDTNRYDRKHWIERDYFLGPRSPVADNVERERDWYHAERGYYDDDLSPRSCWVPRQFIPKHSSFPEKDRGDYRIRINDKYHFSDRNCNDDFDEGELEFLRKSYRMSISPEREIEFLNYKDEEQFPYVDRDWERSDRKDRHSNRPPFVLDDLLSEKREDYCQKYTHQQNSNFSHRRQSYRSSLRNSSYGSRGNENLDVYGRPKHARDSGWFYGYTDAAEDEDFMIDPAEESQFYSSPSEDMKWTEDEIIWRHHETYISSLHDGVQIDDIKLEQHQLNIPRRSNENCSKVLGRVKRWPSVLRCRKSVDLVNGDGKPHTSSRVLCNDKLEYVEQGMAMKQRTLVGYDDLHEKAINSGFSNCDSNHESKKLLQNLLDKKHKDNSDIEEGQIVTEEPYTEASVSRKDVSEGATVTKSLKNRLTQNENNPDQLIGGYDSQKILDSLAKMEKRRERFKQPIAAKKEAEENLMLNDTIVETGEMKQHRPTRKRRWVGS